MAKIILFVLALGGLIFLLGMVWIVHTIWMDVPIALLVDGYSPKCIWGKSVLGELERKMEPNKSVERMLNSRAGHACR